MYFRGPFRKTKNQKGEIITKWVNFSTGADAPSIFFKFGKKTENGKTVTLTSAATIAEIIALQTGLQRLREGGIDSFEKFAQWITPVEEQDNSDYVNLQFIHQKNNIQTKFGLSLNKKNRALFLGIARKESENADSISLHITNLDLLELEAKWENLKKEVMKIENEVEMKRIQKYFDSQNEKNIENSPTIDNSLEDDLIPF